MVDINSKAPDFTLLDTARESVTLSEQRGKKVVLAFFPAAFTGVCEAEMCSFRDSLAELNDANATVLAISVDAPFSNGAFAAKTGANFPILSDYTRKTVAAYGVELPDFAGMAGYVAAKRAVFIVNEDGVITYKWVGPNPGVAPDYDAIKAAL